MMPMTLAALPVLFAAVLVVPARAQVLDHLQCYKIKDPATKARYTAHLEPNAPFPPRPGCLVSVPGRLLCVPASKSNVSPEPPGGGGTGTPNAFVCYKVKCPRVTAPAVQVTDQFGARVVQPGKASLVCAPLMRSTTTTTTLSLPSCGMSPYPVCDGACPEGEPACAPLNVPDFVGCTCPPIPCGTYPACNGPCPAGKVCVGFSLPGYEICGCYTPPP